MRSAPSYRRFRRILVGLALCVCGCSTGHLTESADPGPQRTGQKRAVSMSITLTSRDFSPGAAIPKECTGEGTDRSPQLAWANLPEGTRQLALICDDPDAPTAEPWVHWVIYGLDPTLHELPAGLPKDAVLEKPIRAKQGKNSWPSGQTIGYRGPLPPPGHGVHHYHFTLYALDQPLELAPGADKQQLLKAMQGHILATGELIGTYERKK